MDPKELEKFEPITLLGVLNGMRKAILNARALLRDEEEVDITDFREVP